MKNISGEELIILSGSAAIAISKCMTIEELSEFCELIGLIRHDLETIKFRRIINEKNPAR